MLSGRKLVAITGASRSASTSVIAPADGS
jgi:hypothetical protein